MQVTSRVDPDEAWGLSNSELARGAFVTRQSSGQKRPCGPSWV
jgi:hypothetical protein